MPVPYISGLPVQSMRDDVTNVTLSLFGQADIHNDPCIYMGVEHFFCAKWVLFHYKDAILPLFPRPTVVNSCENQYEWMTSHANEDNFMLKIWDLNWFYLKTELERCDMMITCESIQI